MSSGNLSSLHLQLKYAEEQHVKMQNDLLHAQRELAEARYAGAAILTAVESAMGPVMAELASARRTYASRLPESPRVGDEPERMSSCDALEAEIKHLQLDIEHFQTSAERLQAEERKRLQDLSRLRTELQEAADDLAYEQQRVRHFEVCRQLGLQDGGWVHFGPLGVGKRTLEARSEKKLRESAEQRSCRLVREVTRLAGDTAEHQATIEHLSRQLDRVRKLTREKERRLAGALIQKTELQSRFQGGSPKDVKEGLETDNLAFQQKFKIRSKKNTSSSTGRLPQLSF